MSIGIGIIGIFGQMGQRIFHLLQKDPRFHLVGGYTKRKENSLSLPIYPLSTLIQKSDIIIDFSHPSTLPSLIEEAIIHTKPLVIGTTGYKKEEFSLLEQASQKIPILYSPNFSLGIAICKKIGEEIASLFGKDICVDIVDIHHSRKKDAPSGTALALKERIDKKISKKASIASFRSGSIVGEHILYFTTEEERITLKHEAQNRDLFAKGALEAALFLKEKKPALYSLEDVLEEKK
ncbi:MAG: dihydrodipicolinate reductase C-terminal domain-containing protein [Chlamydiota bacterium]